MRAVLGMLKSLIIGGVIFLLPFGIIVLVLSHLLQISTALGQHLQATIMPQAQSAWLPTLFAILVLLLIALAAGVFARTGAGRALFSSLERVVLTRLPAYVLLRQSISDFTGTADQLGKDEESKNTVVAVHFDDQTQIGLLVDRVSQERLVVYLPGAPSALSGAVAIVDASRVVKLQTKPQQLMAAMRSLGAGIGDIVASARTDTPA